MRSSGAQGLGAGLLAVLAASSSGAADALVAVAANFARPASVLAADFTRSGGGTLYFTAGATGKLYAQILAGAPFDAFLAADDDRPALLEDGGHAVPGSRFSYALGRLAVVDAQANDEAGLARLRAGRFRMLAVANPALAPYGRAAMEVIDGLGLRASASDRIATAENVGQVFALVATGNADMGFVAAAQLADDPRGARAWLVPPHLHGPIRQDAVLLRRGRDNPVAQAFLAYLRSPKGRETIMGLGYDVSVPPEPGQARFPPHAAAGN